MEIKLENMKTKIDFNKRIIIKNEEDTRCIGHALAESAEAGDVIALVGELGTGKTTLAKYIAEGLGVGEEITRDTTAFLRVSSAATMRWQSVVPARPAKTS